MVMFHNERQPGYMTQQDLRRSTSPDVVANPTIQNSSPSKSAAPPLETQYTVDDGPQKNERLQMLEKGNSFLEQHRTQVAKAESEALYYKELEKNQDNLKLKNQVNLLTNQVKSLK